MLLHLGAVDYRASVWLDGALLGTHEGGHTPFSFDITEHVAEGDAWTLVVRAEDDPLDVGQPRGKQDWLPDPHVIWYHRTTGIWQPVWLEAVPALAVRTLHWTPDLPTATVRLEVALDRVPADGTTCRVVVTHEGRHLAESTTTVARDRFTVVLPVPEQANGQGYERLLWTPEHPVLLDAQVTIAGPAGTDVIDSYLGLRSAAVDRGAFLLNDRPVYLRSVLEQGYWPESHLAAPSAEALRAEVQLIRDLGFNSVRIHQKFEDPRFLYWTDRLGVLVWSEAPGAYESSPTAITRTVREWLEVLDRDRSHPSIVTWVPLNESWGVQHIAASPALRVVRTGAGGADPRHRPDPPRDLERRLGARGLRPAHRPRLRVAPRRRARAVRQRRCVPAGARRRRPCGAPDPARGVRGRPARSCSASSAASASPPAARAARTGATPPRPAPTTSASG